MHRPKKYNPLPKVLAIEEVADIINVLDNIKHKCMISLIYSAGLRRSELLNMRISNLYCPIKVKKYFFITTIAYESVQIG